MAKPDGIRKIFRYGSRALWSLSPSMKSRVRQRAQELANEVPDPCLPSPNDEVSPPSRILFPLISTTSDPERVCGILQRRIAEYARDISGESRLKISNLRTDEIVLGIIGTSDKLGSVDVADIVQACVGKYIYDNILLSTEPHEILFEQDWEQSLHTWLTTRFGLDRPLRTSGGLLELVLDTAMSFKVVMDHAGLRINWPRNDADFDRRCMVSWARPASMSQHIILALTFVVQEEEKDEEEEEDDEYMGNDVVYPATVLLQGRSARKTNQSLEVERLRHLLTTDERVLIPIQASVLQKDRDWDGYPVHVDSGGGARTRRHEKRAKT